MGFLSTLSLRRATIYCHCDTSYSKFLSTLSLRRATSRAHALSVTGSISIHALLAESDFCIFHQPTGISDFYPRSPCGERLTARIIDPTYGKISIHALLAESDTQSQIDARVIPISIHALLAESDGVLGRRLWDRQQFLSTLSLRRATTYPSQWRTLASDFYPRSPCGERPSKLHKILADWGFLSTLSLRRATTGTTSAKMQQWDFYPRSPCGERLYTAIVTPPIPNFYPRSPCGERLPGPTPCRSPGPFLSTLSLRRATFAFSTSRREFQISIHALLAESD